MGAPDVAAATRGRGGWRFALLVGAVASVSLTLAATGWWRQVSPERVRDLATRAGPWGPLAFIAGYTFASLPFLPRSVMALGGGMAFGLPSAGYTYVGALLGETLAFGLARGLGRDFVANRLGNRFAAWDARTAAHGFRTVLVLRLIPVVPCDIVNYGAGLSSVRYRDFLGGTALGIIPGCCAYAAVGDGLVTAKPGVLVFGVGALGVLALLPLAWRRRAATAGAPAAAEPPR